MNKKLRDSLKFIKNNEPIILPTDTVYGLVCRYDSKSAVEKIYKLKKRSRRKPLILLGHNWRALKRFVKTPIRHSNWPGPLTIVIPASKNVPKFLNRGFKTIGVRIPNNKFLLRLLKYCPGQVLASTSANISGKKNVNEIAKRVKLFIKARKGEMSYKPSRVVEIRNGRIKILR